MTSNKTVAKELGLLLESHSNAYRIRNIDTNSFRYTAGHGPFLGDFDKYVDGYVRRYAPPHPSGFPRLFKIVANADIVWLQQRTRWFIFIGARLSPELIRLSRTGLVFVFEPARERMDAFLEELPTPLLRRKNIWFFSGELDSFDDPLLYLLPAGATALGQPVFFVHPDVESVYAERVKLVVEIHYYHYQIYPYEQKGAVSDVWPVAGGFTFSQTKHLLENLGLLADQRHVGIVENLRGAQSGKTALLVAAGPDLGDALPVIRRLAKHCVVICAGKVYTFLVQHGVRPDVCLLMDSSLASAQELADAPPGATSLVSHILAGAARFPGGVNRAPVFFLGDELEQIGLPSCSLPLVGSVMNYAFFLARHMGCGRIICAGLQLASRVCKGDGYAKGTAPLSGASQSWPYPVRVPGLCDYLYTTLNFLDVSLRIRAEVRKSGIQVINLTRESLLHGEGIVYDPNPSVQEGTECMGLPLPASPLPPRTGQRVKSALKRYHETWSLLAQPELLLDPDATLPFARRFLPLLQKLDANGTSHLLRTVPEFDAPGFAAGFFGSDPEGKTAAAQAYLTALRATAHELKGCAEVSLAQWSAKTKSSHDVPDTRFAR